MASPMHGPAAPKPLHSGAAGASTSAPRPACTSHGASHGSAPPASSSGVPRRGGGAARTAGGWAAGGLPAPSPPSGQQRARKRPAPRGRSASPPAPAATCWVNDQGREAAARGIAGEAALGGQVEVEASSDGSGDSRLARRGDAAAAQLAGVAPAPAASEALAAALAAIEAAQHEAFLGPCGGGADCEEAAALLRPFWSGVAGGCGLGWDFLRAPGLPMVHVPATCCATILRKRLQKRGRHTAVTAQPVTHTAVVGWWLSHQDHQEQSAHTNKSDERLTAGGGGGKRLTACLHAFSGEEPHSGEGRQSSAGKTGRGRAEQRRAGARGPQGVAKQVAGRHA